MLKKILLLLIAVVFIGANPLLEAASFQQAKTYAAQGSYKKASLMYYKLSQSTKHRKQRGEIKYVLGLLLFKMKMYQVAGFVFYEVISEELRKGKSNSPYITKSLTKITEISNFLNTDVLLQLAISKVGYKRFPASQRDMLYYKMGESKMDKREFSSAIKLLSKIPSNSSFYPQAKYRQALAFAEKGDEKNSFITFHNLEKFSAPGGITYPNKVNATLGKARVLYQGEKFNESLEYYRRIPRDTVQWHDSLFERSWAMIQTGKLRSALSNFHSLHSPYYEDYYMPESLILRAMVYLYICRYDEVEKTISLYNKVYAKIHRKLVTYMKVNRSPMTYTEQARAVYRYVEENKGERPTNLQLPYPIVRHLLKDKDVYKSIKYLSSIENEYKRYKLMPEWWRKSSVGSYTNKILNRRVQNSALSIGKIIQKNLNDIRVELRALAEQNDFIRLEVINGKKKAVKKIIAGEEGQVDKGKKRSYYVQNGYEYWPFQGEYWLDEIGNYHYVGVDACGK